MAANALHALVLLCAYGLLLAVTTRPGLSALLVLALVVLLVLVDRDKQRTLQEPFLACDFIYFWDVIRHPKLYLPYFGYGKAALLAAGFVVLVVAWWITEPRLDIEPAWRITMWALLLAMLAGWIALKVAQQLSPSLSLDPAAELHRLGLIATLAAYQTKAHQTRADPDRVLQGGPLAGLKNACRDSNSAAPIILCLQLESFADFRRTYPHHLNAHRAALPAWDALRSQAWATGTLRVPAFGANTVRSEFEFLFGISVSDMGVHGFEPYQWIGQSDSSRFCAALPAALAEIGFKSVFVHPYDRAFYRRDRVLPKLGFDTFVDARAFSEDPADGPAARLVQGINGYISDAALGKKLIELVQAQPSTQALFVHGVTMQGHGPYLAGRGPHTADATFAGYQACMMETDQMLDDIWSVLKQLDRPVVLCAFGDHVPILPEVYGAWGMPDGKTDYLIWRNQAQDSMLEPREPVELACHELAAQVLAAASIMTEPRHD